MEITVLGCSGGYGSAALGATSGYVVQHGSTALWVDCGSGTLAALHGRVDPAALSGVVLTHRHADHCVDLIGLHVYLKYEAERVGLPVFSAPEIREVLEPFTGGGFGNTFAWDEVDDGDTRTVGTLGLKFKRTQHPVPTVAVEVTAPDGARLVYTSDTGPEWAIASFAPGASLVIAEATYNSQASGPAHHLTAAEAGAAARAAAARRLVITHLWPTLDPELSRREATAAFGAAVEVARAGSTLTV